MQQADQHPTDEDAMLKKTSHFGGSSGESHHDQSPFNSKFTVLKFNSHGKSPI
jgi:hypothetical protein